MVIEVVTTLLKTLHQDMYTYLHRTTDMVDGETVNPEVAEVAFINVNDKTVEGLRYKNKSIFTVQFHPEACLVHRIRTDCLTNLFK